MNFGEKFPYALLTFSQSLSKLVIGGTPYPNNLSG